MYKYNYSVIIPHFTRDGNIEALRRAVDSVPERKDIQVFVIDNSINPIPKNLFEDRLNVSIFLFGIGDHNHYDFNSTTDSGIGNQSDLLDVLGRYGLIGGLILYSSIKIYYDYLMRNYDSSYIWEIKAFFILLISTGLTKQFMAETPAIVIFVLFPLCLKYFSNKQFQY